MTHIDDNIYIDPANTGKFSDNVKLPDGWIETTLGEVCEKIGDGLHGTPNYSESGSYFFINGNNITKGRIDIKKDTKIIDQIEFKKYKKDLNDKTILLSINGTIGNLAKYRNEKCILGKSIAYLNVKNNISRDFIYYLMFENRFQYEISKNANGSTIKNVGLAQLRNYSFLIPSFYEQQAIASVLSAFDDKIELLREQNKMLELIGQTIFSEWFGKYGLDDELVKAYEILEFEKGIEVGSNNYFENKTDLENPEMFYRVGDISNNGNLSSLYCEKDLLKNRIFKSDDVLVSFDGTVGRVFIGGNGGYSSGIRKIFAKEANIKGSFLYFWAKSEGVQEIINLYSEGTTIQHAGKSIPYLEIISDQENINKITERLDPIFIKILDNLDQIQSLDKSRDELLSKLMRGEVRVKI